MNRVLCSAPGWTEPLCLRFFRLWHTGLPVRSGSEAGSGCVRRSADAAQSPFSTADPLVPFCTATHQVVLLLQPQQDTDHTHLGPRGRGTGQMRGEDRGQKEGRHGTGKVTAWPSAILVTDLTGKDVYQSAAGVSANICHGWTTIQIVIHEIFCDCKGRDDENDTKIGHGR